MSFEEFLMAKKPVACKKLKTLPLNEPIAEPLHKVNQIASQAIYSTSPGILNSVKKDTRANC
jgi:hypothetical protein